MMHAVTERCRLGLVVAVVVMSSACATVPEDLRDSRLALQRGTFSGEKYTIDGSEPEGVYSFFGTYNNDYLELLSEQPEALAVAKSAQPYQYASLVVTAVAGIYGISELIAAANSGNDSFAELDETESHVTNVLVAALVMVAANAVLQIPARNRLYDSARMYNEGLDAPDVAHLGFGTLVKSLPNSIEWNRLTRGVDVGWVIRR